MRVVKIHGSATTAATKTIPDALTIPNGMRRRVVKSCFDKKDSDVDAHGRQCARRDGPNNCDPVEPALHAPVGVGFTTLVFISMSATPSPENVLSVLVSKQVYVRRSS